MKKIFLTMVMVLFSLTMFSNSVVPTNTILQKYGYREINNMTFRKSQLSELTFSPKWGLNKFYVYNITCNKINNQTVYEMEGIDYNDEVCHIIIYIYNDNLTLINIKSLNQKTKYVLNKRIQLV